MPLQQAVVEAWKAAEKSRKISAGKQRVGNVDLPTGFPPPLYTHTTSGRCRARRLVCHHDLQNM
jgi:hypothetical protein